MTLNSITLAWKPIGAGVDHTLKVLKKTASGSWDSLYTIPSILSSPYTVGNLEAGREYRFIMRSKCPNGEVSQNFSISDGILSILELSILGKTPLEPIVVDCESIDYLNHDYQWVGFRVYYNKGDRIISNLFEYKKVDIITSQIRRMKLEHNLVAVNENEIWPTQNQPIVPVELEVQMGELTNNETSVNNLFIFGTLIISTYSTPGKLKICPDPASWHPFYKFEALVATKTTDLSGENSDNRFDNSILHTNKFRIENPFNEKIEIFNDHVEESSTELITVSIYDLNGRVAIRKQFENSLNQISLEASSILPGCYFLRIEHQGYFQIAKIIKYH